MNILCTCGKWNDYIDTNRAFHEGWNVHCHSCGALIFDYEKARKLEREDKEIKKLSENISKTTYKSYKSHSTKLPFNFYRCAQCHKAIGQGIKYVNIEHNTIYFCRKICKDIWIEARRLE